MVGWVKLGVGEKTEWRGNRSGGSGIGIWVGLSHGDPHANSGAACFAVLDPQPLIPFCPILGQPIMSIRHAFSILAVPLRHADRRRVSHTPTISATGIQYQPSRG